MSNKKSRASTEALSEERSQPISTTSRHNDVHGLLDQAFEKFQASPAIAWRNQSVTYSQLDEAANRLANGLISCGVSHGSIVAVLVQERIDVVLALLGTLRAGGVFAPLDLEAPAEHLRKITGNLRPDCLITEEALAGVAAQSFPDDCQPKSSIHLQWKGIEETIAGRILPTGQRLEDVGCERPRISAKPDDVCYIYHTSGSTGPPKGIAGTHKGLSHFIRWEIGAFGIAAGWRVSQFAIPTFDAFLRDVLVPLCAGGTIIIPPDSETVLDPKALLAWIDDSGIRLIHCVPTLFSSMVRALPVPGTMDSLEYILMAGEVLPVSDVKKWREFYGDRVQLVNLYGPTETTMIKFCYRVQKSDTERTFIPIGQPIDGAMAVILDEAGRPCPQGNAGEIHIRTPYRTLGYYNQPELTREVFIQNPINDDPRDLIYKTGDIGRVLHDGNFQFVRRKDLQVKVRGVRIELGEIEAALGQHPAVHQTVVAAREDATAGKSLVAYLVVDGAAQPTTTELRQFLQRKLPGYMIPTAYVLLDKLPLTRNGKVDRRRLPAPESIRPQLEKPYLAPRNPTEQALARIWCDVLSVEKVGVHDNFFDLGGHSLLANRVISRVREQFRWEVPLAALFQEPTVANLAVAIDHAEQGTTPPTGPPILPVSRSAEIPLSFAQQRLWVLDQLIPEVPVYNMPSAVQITGVLDFSALLATLDEIIRRHEALRTTFSAVEGRPSQVIASDFNLRVPVIDLSGLPEANRNRQARSIRDEEAQRPFHLKRGPLIRVSLLRLGARQHNVLVTIHHIVFDEWSHGIFVQELAVVYNAFCHGHPSPLPNPPVQYADFSQWQREWFQGEVLQEQLAYWEQRLTDVPVLQLPTDRPRPMVQTFVGARYHFHFPESLSQSVNELSRRAGTTLFMTLLAVFQLLLSRYSGQDDIAVGSAIAGRNRSETEGLIGFFVNSLVLRTDLSGNPSFRGLLQRVREVCLGAYAHQDLPFEKLVDELQPDRDLGREPLFQVMITLLNTPRSTLEIPAGVTLQALDLDRGTAKFDLTCFFTESAGSIGGAIEYRTDLFDESRIVRMVGHFRMLLESVVADPEACLSQLPMLTEGERQQLLVDWNDTQREFGAATACVHQRFVDRARERPEAVALVWTDESQREHEICYRELDTHSNQLAHYLRTRGVGPEVRVGICVGRSVELLVGLLGILKAGGVYVPLDPDNPRERLAYMLSDSGASLVLTVERLGEHLSSANAQRVYLDSDWDTISQFPDTMPIGATSPTNAAYVIYTSGSTGQPKGAVLLHEGLANLCSWHQEAYEVIAADRATQVAGLSFDASVWELWPYLTAGACVHFPDETACAMPSLLVDYISSRRITLCFLPTPLAERALQEPWPIELSLRALLTGGDVLHRAPTQRLPFRLVNHYGPTENTVVTTCSDVTPQGTLRSPPIGRPISNTEVFVLDWDLRPVPLGIPGELYIGGVGLARGYLDRPELTAKHFLPHPFSQRRGSRIYRTGDSVRWLGDGQLEFLGRLDHQVMIRGFRIELGEIESVLSGHPAVAQAVVTARHDPLGNNRLSAYVVMNPGHDPSEPLEDHLRHYLREKLPDYMVPAIFVVLDSMPTMPSGKVDRSKLPAPDHVVADSPETYVAPTTPVEEKLVALWCEVLGVERVGVRDNFFQLGGDSLLGIQVVARAQQVKLLLTPRQIFECQTIAELAAVVDTVKASQAQQDLVTGPTQLSPIQHWFFEQQFSDPHHFNQSLMFEVREPLEMRHVLTAVETVLAHHDALRLRFTQTVDGWQQHSSGSEACSAQGVLAEVDLRGIADHRQRATIEKATSELQASLNHLQGPLIRIVLIKTRSDSERMLLVVHHLAVDAVSWQILLQDLLTVYQQLTRRAPVALPPKTTSFQAWTDRLVAYAHSETLADESEYWRAVTTARGVPLPRDMSDGADDVASEQQVVVSLGVEETQALLREVPQAYRTQINDVLLAALVRAHDEWTGEKRLLLQLEAHGREDLFDDIDLSRTVGWFTALYPVLLDVRDRPWPGEVLKAVKEQLRRVPNHGIGYGLLRYLGPDRELAARLDVHPEIRFNYLGQMTHQLPPGAGYAPAPESQGPVQSPRAKRTAALSITGSVLQDQLYVKFTYSCNLHAHRTIERWAEGLVVALRELIVHCQSRETEETPSDFPLAGLDEKKLDHVAKLLEQIDEDPA